MTDLCERIAQANDVEIEQLLKAVLHRYSELFPDWDVRTISLHRSSDHNEQLDNFITMLEKMKTLP